MKYVPLRDWACPSYDPATGRAASSLHNPADVTIEGERIRPSAQLPHDPGADGGGLETNRRSSQPVRQIGQCCVGWPCWL
jgi:hypothetical protein